MSQASKIIGESKVGHKNRITLVGELVRILKVKEGDTIVYILDEKGNIILKNSKDVKISIQY
jgi:bifunctional DNA-binding transcriptional regulator/antitoxin component of YhaV-PrlF toxin-antitoxin module